MVDRYTGNFCSQMFVYIANHPNNLSYHEGVQPMLVAIKVLTTKFAPLGFSGAEYPTVLGSNLASQNFSATVEQNVIESSSTKY